MSKTIYTKEYRFVLSQLKNARIETGLTQKEAAKIIGKPLLTYWIITGFSIVPFIGIE